MTDIYSWIMSPEIREFWRKNYQPTVMERLELIRGAYRPMEERLDALCALLKEAKTRRERRAISEDIRLFRYALREIYDTKPGQFFLLRHPHHGVESKFVGWSPVGVFATFPALLDDLDVEVTYWRRYGFMVEKWDMAGKAPEEMFTFNLRLIDGKPAITTLYVNPSQKERVGVSQGTLDRDNYGLSRRHPYDLPFFTGQLVKLDAPMFNRPVFGILYSEDDLNGCRDIFLGYIPFYRRGWRFETIDLSYQEIDDSSWGLRVIDWLHHATSAELPKEQKLLGDISLYLRHLRRKDRLAAEKLFFRIFDYPSELRLCHIAPVTLSELLREAKI